MIGNACDPTVWKRTEERTLQAERLLAMGQMLAAVTHESRHLLQLAQCNLDLLSLELQELQTRPKGLEQAQYCLQRTQKAHDSLRRLFEELRGFAAPIVLETESCHLGRIVTQVVQEMTAQGQRLDIHNETNGTDLRCVADPLRMHQVFRNLLENSVAACPSPAQIRIAWEETLLHQQPALAISLCDNGPGLAAEQRERMFEPFFTTKSRGTGLGLTITQRIIEAHGGQITLGNRLGRGAEFVITIPHGKTAQRMPPLAEDFSRIA